MRNAVTELSRRACSSGPMKISTIPRARVKQAANDTVTHHAGSHKTVAEQRFAFIQTLLSVVITDQRLRSLCDTGSGQHNNVIDIGDDGVADQRILSQIHQNDLIE